MKVEIEETAKEVAFQAALLCDSDSHKPSNILKRLLDFSALVCEVLIEVEGAQCRTQFCKLIRKALQKVEKTYLWLTLAWEAGEVKREDYRRLNDSCTKLKELLTAVLKIHNC